MFEVAPKPAAISTSYPLDVFRDNRVYKFSNANLIERPGPRIVLGLQELAKLIHPEIFGEAK